MGLIQGTPEEVEAFAVQANALFDIRDVFVGGRLAVVAALATYLPANKVPPFQLRLTDGERPASLRDIDIFVPNGLTSGQLKQLPDGPHSLDAGMHVVLSGKGYPGVGGHPLYASLGGPSNMYNPFERNVDGIVKVRTVSLGVMALMYGPPELLSPKHRKQLGRINLLLKQVRRYDVPDIELVK